MRDTCVHVAYMKVNITSTARYKFHKQRTTTFKVSLSLPIKKEKFNFVLNYQ
jgi:hypothetical protein